MKSYKKGTVTSRKATIKVEDTDLTIPNIDCEISKDEASSEGAYMPEPVAAVAEALAPALKKKLTITETTVYVVEAPQE